MRLAAFAALGLMTGTGCGSDECDLDDTRCVDGDTIEVCTRDTESDEPAHWERRDCYDEAPYCATAPTGRDLCAVHADAYLGCPQLAGTAAVCDGDAVLSCEDGLAVWVVACAGPCFLVGDTPTCSLLPEPDPLCGDLPATCADEQTRIDCVDGWRTAEKRCDTAGGCVEFDAATCCSDTVGHRAVCSLDAEQDPMCEPGIYDAYCATPTTAVTCWYGYVILRDECADQATSSGDDPCFDHGYWAECITPVLSHEGSEYGR
jgi:hypothetical protein